MNRKLILAIDDSKTQLVFLQMALEQSGFNVITADNGLEGVSKVFIERPDLVISDIQMPEMTGYQLCRLLKNNKETKHIPIILLTCLDQPQDKFWGIRAGADCYIVKNSDHTNLIEQTNKLLSKATQLEQIDKSYGSQKNNINLKSLKSSLNYLLDKLLFETTLSNEASRLAGFIDKREKLLKEISNLVYSLIDFSCLCICMYENDETVFHYDVKESISEDEIKSIQESLLAPTITKNVRKSFLVDSQPIDNRSTEKLLSQYSTILVLNENCFGSISVFSIKKNAFTQESENIIQLLAKDFTMIIKLMLLYAETKRLSITDGLTGLNNNRYFKEILELEFERAKRYKRNLSLILIDVDHFKSINDTYGHLQGDIVLKELSSILKQDIRKGDFVARYGGEEFAVLAFDTDLHATLGVAEKIRQKIADHSFDTDHGNLKVTISLGVASISDNTSTIFDLIKKADQSLYRAKNEGRNRSCIDNTD